jgi:hypothetical protein
MADQPVLRSQPQIAGDLTDGFLSRATSVTDLSQQSVLSQFITAISQSNFRASAAIIQMLDALSIDRAVGGALQTLARDRQVPILSGNASTGNVDITDNTFSKIETGIYAGQPAPVAGSATIYVVDASAFNPTGQVYIGRTTPNVEGPLTYTSVTAQAGGAYWAINLAGSSLTTKFHNLGERVIMAQGGNRLIRSGSSVQTASGSNSSPIVFNTTSNATIQDGETTVSAVPIVCAQSGTDGNVPKSAIVETVSFPFSSSCVNSQPFTNGKAPDDDDTLRERIKAYEQAKSKGTAQAIETASIDVFSPDDLKRVSSANIVTYADTSSALVFDDGTGYEAIFTGVGLETVVDSALGGEINLQLRQYPILQARVINNLAGPFNILQNDAIDVEIQGDRRTHFFNSTDFLVPGAGTVSEIANSINSDPNFHAYATTATNTSRIALYPRNRLQNEITVVARGTTDDASVKIGFPLNTEYTIRLYKNDIPLFQDGQYATVATTSNANWLNTITDGDTLIYSVDKAPPITATFTTALFQTIDITATVSSQTALSTWVAVMNLIMSGVTASINGDTINLTSNLGLNNRASIEIQGGTLLSKMFPVNVDVISTGRGSDYTLNRQTGQFALNVALIKGDSVTAGSSFTRANIITSSIPSGPTIDGNTWMVVDGAAKLIPNGLKLNTQVFFESYATGKMRIRGESATLTPEGFENVAINDWILIWGEASDATAYPIMYANRGYWRVESIDGGLIVNIDGNFSPTFGSEPSVPLDRIVAVETLAPIQHLGYTAASIGGFITQITTDLLGVDADAIGSSVRLSSQTSGAYGEILIVAADSGAKSIGINPATISDNITSHYGFIVTADSEAGTPLFTHSVFGTKTDDHTFQDSNYETFGGKLDNFAEILNDYEADVSNFRELPDSNKSRRVYTEDFNESTNNITLKIPPYMTSAESPIQTGDRYFLRESYQFDSTDDLTFIVDGDDTTKTYTAPVARNVIVDNHSTPSTQDFSASDAQSSLALADPSSFFNFDFSDFKVWRQAGVELLNGTNSIRIKFGIFGPAGNSVRVGYVYPSNNTQTSLSYTTLNNEAGAIGIVLPVTTPRTPNWDGTTSFTTDVVTTGGKDTVTYTYRVGTQPNFGVGGAAINNGDIAMIDPTSDQLSQNKNFSARVSTVSATTFSIQRPTGTAISDNIPIASMQNINGVVTAVTAQPHLILQGDRIGIWGTSSVDGFNYPFQTTYYPTVVNSTTFTFSAPVGTPGGAIISATHAANIVTVTASAHGLQVGNVIIVSGISNPNYNGTHTVSAVLSSSQFQYIVTGSDASVVGGRFDFQSYALDPASTTSIQSITKTGYSVTVNSTGESIAVGELVQIAGAQWSTYNSATTYGTNDTVFYSGINYVSLVSGNTSNQPDISPAQWAITSLTLNGNYVVTSTVPGVSLTFVTDFLGNGSATTGTATAIRTAARIARSLGPNAAMLQFAQVSTTAQAIIDYATTQIPDLLGAALDGGTSSDVINLSTADTTLSGNYYTATVTAMAATEGSSLLNITVNANIPAGSDISLTTDATGYSDSYVVLTSTQVGSSWVLSIRTRIVSPTTGPVTFTTGNIVGAPNYLMMTDGENFVKSSNLQSVPTLPQFSCKRAWIEAPAIGEELRLIASTTEQLTRFWNVLTVTGLSNVATIDNSDYGRQLQVRTQTFGASGSIQATGGNASGGQIAIVGAGNEIDSKTGSLTIPFAAHDGLNGGSWIQITQNTRQNKILGFDGTTVINTSSNGLTLAGGSGSFQTARVTTQDSTTKMKVERQGNYMAFIGVYGTSLGLASDPVQYVREGDWVRLSNTAAGSAWSASVTYSPGARVDYIGYQWLQISGGPVLADIPGTDTSWQRLGVSFSNEGIFQVVRVFGQNTFYIQNTLGIDEMVQLGAGSELSFYSYDSVMPGDTLVIAGNILNSLNVGRYTVLDQNAGPGYAFPTATRIYTLPIPVVQGNTVLGDSFIQVNIEEANPLQLLKRIVTIAPSDVGYANVIVDSFNLINKVSSSLGAAMVFQNKIAYNNAIAFGVDSYRYYGGLVEELNRVIYGDPTDPLNFPGIRAAGTNVDIKPALVKRITVALAVRLKSGVPFIELRDRIKASVAGYVNSLGVGDQVSLSSIVDAAGKINGVTSVVITSPTYDVTQDQIFVGSDMRAAVVNPTNDVVVASLTS